MTQRQRIIDRLTENAENKKLAEEYKKLKEDLVLVKIPYGSINDHFLVPSLISKASLEQIKMYDELIKKEIEKAKEAKEAKEEKKEENAEPENKL